MSTFVSFLISTWSGMTPSAGTGNSISVGGISSRSGRMVGRSIKFSLSGATFSPMFIIKPHGIRFCWITDTWTSWRWSSSVSGWLSYVQIFSCIVNKSQTVNILCCTKTQTEPVKSLRDIWDMFLTLAVKFKAGLSILGWSSKETLYLVFVKDTFAVVLYVSPERTNIHMQLNHEDMVC